MALWSVAEATGLTGRCRTFPAADSPGMLASASSGGRSSGQPAGGWPARYRPRRGRPGNLAGPPPPPRLSTFPQPRLIHTYTGG